MGHERMRQPSPQRREYDVGVFENFETWSLLILKFKTHQHDRAVPLVSLLLLQIITATVVRCVGSILILLVVFIIDHKIMGGDGGVIPKNRQYLRGAGDAKKTGHHPTISSSHVADPQVRQEARMQALRQCALTQQPLDLMTSGSIVACPYGRLYTKEAIVEALLKRKQSSSAVPADPRLEHIRGLKDLHPVRFQVTTGSNDNVPTDNNNNNTTILCPVRGIELNGHVPAVLLCPGNPHEPNVVSARALQELGMSAMAEDYGPIDQTLPLLPTDAQLIQIKQDWAVTLQKSNKKQHKDHKKTKKSKDKKRKRLAEDPTTTRASPLKTTVSPAQQSSTTSNKVLQSLFVDPSKRRDSADTLFARR